MQSPDFCKGLALAALLAAAPTPGLAVDTLTYLHTVQNPAYRLETAEFDFARRNIARGYQVLGQVLNGSHSALGNAQADGADVVAVMWALFDAACAKDQGYEQGSYVVEDRHGHLLRFLSGNAGAYQRPSTHLDKASQLTGAGHYGIDVLGAYQPGETGWLPYTPANAQFTQQNLLPARKGTILFIPLAADPAIGLSTRHLFIKTEDHGMRTWSGYFHHGWDLVAGRVRKALGLTPDEVARKERIDDNLAAAYAQILARVPQGETTQLTRDARNLGVRVMLAEAARLQGLDPALDQAIASFQAIVAAKGYDHLQARTGDEVIFSEQDLRLAMLPHLQARPETSADREAWVMDFDPSGPCAPAPEPEPAKGFLEQLRSWWG